MSLYFPPECAIVFYEQAGDSVPGTEKNLFPSKPSTAADVVENADYVDYACLMCEAYMAGTAEYFLDKNPNIRSILDIGCGLAYHSLALYQALDPKPILYLVDSSRPPSDELQPADRSFQWHHQPTIHLDTTLDFLTGNGVQEAHIRLVEPLEYDAWPHVYPVDLIASWGSWGFLYPTEVFWHGVEGALHSGSMVYTDLRKEFPNSLAFFQRNFNRVEVLMEDDSQWRILASGPEWMS